MKYLQTILKNYGMTAYDMKKITSRLYKVYVGDRSVAVKQMKNNRDPQQVMKVYNLAKESNLSQVIPVYLTRTGSLFSEYEQQRYYVMPWIEGQEQDTPTYRFESIYKTIGSLHKKTVQSQEFSGDASEFVKQQRDKMKRMFSKLEDHISQFEKRHYMAPVELQICTQFKEVGKAFELMEKWYERWEEDINEDETVRYAFSHGNLTSGHFIYDDQHPYLINWEKAHWGHPMEDLSGYIRSYLKFHDAPIEQIVKTFSSYEAQFSLLNSERSLLALHLLQPSPYLQALDTYVDNREQIVQTRFTAHLSRLHRTIVHATQIQESLEQARDFVRSQASKSEE